MRRLPHRRRNSGNVGRRRSQRSEFRREKLVELIERIGRRGGPCARTWELPVEVFHPATKIVDHRLVVQLIRDHARRDEHDDLGAIVLDVLLAEQPVAADRQPVVAGKDDDRPE